MRFQHILRIKDLVEFLLRHESLLKNYVIDGSVGLESLLGDLRAGLVTDVRIEGGNYSDGILDHVIASLFVYRDALDALVLEGVDGVGEPGQALEEALGDHRLHHVELELACLRRESNGGIVADDLEADLIRHLRDDRVDLSRHDAGSRSLRRKIDLTKSAARAGRKESEVVAHLGYLNGKTLYGAGIAYVGTGIRGGLHKVQGADEGLAGQLAEILGAKFRKTRDGVESGSDGGAAHVDFMKQLYVAVEIEDFLLKIVGKGVEFLTYGHRDGILELGAAHLDDLGVFLGLGTERIDQACEAADKMLVHPHQGQTDRRRIDIVGGLAAIDVVVRIAVLIVSFLMAHDFQGPVRYDLVSVHVDGGSGSALHHVDREVFVHLAVDYLAARLTDGPGDFVVDYTEAVVRLDSGEFDVGYGHDKVREITHLSAGDVVIVDGALSLDSIVDVIRDLEFTQKVRFNPEFLFAHDISDF